MLQISTLLYESVSLLIVIRISVKACIDVTLYDELFKHLHNREKFLSPLVTKDKFWPLLVIQSWITLCTSQQTFESRHTSGAVPSMAYFRFYGQGIEDDLRLFSLFCRGRVLSLTQIHTLQRNQELLLCWSILNSFKNLSRHASCWNFH